MGDGENKRGKDCGGRTGWSKNGVYSNTRGDGPGLCAGCGWGKEAWLQRLLLLPVVQRREMPFVSQAEKPGMPEGLPQKTEKNIDISTGDIRQQDIQNLTPSLTVGAWIRTVGAGIRTVGAGIRTVGAGIK